MATRVTRSFGSPDLRLPDELRGPLMAHLEHLRERFLARNWAGRVGFGNRPALIVIDMAKFWLTPRESIGADLEFVVDHVCHVLAAARAASIPVFFTTYAFDPADPPSPQNRKLCVKFQAGD